MKAWLKEYKSVILAIFALLGLLLLPVFLFIIFSLIGGRNTCAPTFTERLDNDYSDCVQEEPTVKSTTVVVTKPTVKELQSLVNKERTKRNLGALALSTELTKSAQDKCKDMEKRNYWSHDTPDGEEPWVFIQRYVTSYISAGENLGRGYTDSESMVKAWMDSKSHRANILKPEYSHVGYAVCNGKINNLVVQHLTQL